jgi:hypothetical protein
MPLTYKIYVYTIYRKHLRADTFDSHAQDLF